MTIYFYLVQLRQRPNIRLMFEPTVRLQILEINCVFAVTAVYFYNKLTACLVSQREAAPPKFCDLSPIVSHYDNRVASAHGRALMHNRVGAHTEDHPFL